MAGLNVFNPDMHMAVAGGATKELMQQHARNSHLMLAVMSHGGLIFDSPWCRAEMEAARDASVPIVPVYNGDMTTLKEVKSIVDQSSDQLVQYVCVQGASPGARLHPKSEPGP